MRQKSNSEPPGLVTTATAPPQVSPEAPRQHDGRYEPGERLADFVIESFIAEGGFGSVYRATHHRLGTVALKISHLTTNLLSTEALALQQDEVEALIRLRHPSLVRVLDHGPLSDHRYYLALELVEGESLRAFMTRRGRVDVIEAIALMRRLAEGIAYCHQFNILHLDLKPSNVIVVDAHTPDLKIIDFGVAAFAENWFDLKRRSVTGTPLYMAPEMLSDTPDIGEHCDVYALGLIFYELLTGRFPFSGANIQVILHNKLQGEKPSVKAAAPDLPEAIAVVVDALLHPDPAQRGFTAAAMEVHLKEQYFEILRHATGGAPRTRHVSSDGEAQLAPFVGRDGELAALVARAETVSRREDAVGWAVMISGDPGIGKSRILAELIGRLQSEGVVMGYGRCREHGNLISYASWRECLGQLHSAVVTTTHPRGDDAGRAIRDLLADPAVADLVELVPDLQQMRLTSARALPSAPVLDVGSARVSRAVRRLVTAIARHLPTVLILEDLQWADQGTLDLLGALVSSALPPGLLILCTARPEAELPRWSALEYLRLEPLDERRNVELLRALSGDTSVAAIAELTAAIPLLCMGNPLVDTQVILHLKREGLLARDAEGRMVLAGQFGHSYVPPTSVSSVLERRLQRLRERARDILGVASIIGRQFHLSDLQQIVGPEIGAQEVEEAVHQGVELALCHADRDEYIFVHDVIRDHLVTTVPPARRADLHGRIARTLRERGAPPATIAYHLDQAGAPAAAAAMYFDGGLEADRVHDLVGSCRSLRRALALYLELASSPERDRALARTAYELARITCLLGKTHEPLEDLERCRRSMIAPPDDAMVMFHSAYARVYYAQGDFERAVQHSEQSLAVDDRALDPYQCVPANMLGRALCASGHFGPSIEVLRRGCQLARAANDLVELAHSEGLLGTALAFTGEFEQSRQHIADSNRLAELLDNPTRRMGVCLYRTLHAEAAFQWEDGIRTSAQLLAHAEEYKMSGLYLYLGTLMAGRHHTHIGELQRARHLLRNAINFSTLFGIRIARSWAYAYLGDVHLIEGQLEEALHWYETGLELANEGRGDGFGIPLSLIGMAHASACLGIARARVGELAQRSFQAFEAASNIVSLATALVRYGEALAACGDDGDASTEVRARLHRVLDRLGIQRCEFWPVAPASATPAERALGAAEYWRRRAEDPTVLSDEAGDLGVTAGSLLVQLSTVDGFLPAFVAQQLP